MFKPVPTRVDYVQLEHEVQDWWDQNGIPQKYLDRRRHGGEPWSFIDGPITAKNPMGVHHAWGRSYKDLYNRFWTLCAVPLGQAGPRGAGYRVNVETLIKGDSSSESMPGASLAAPSTSALGRTGTRAFASKS